MSKQFFSGKFFKVFGSLLLLLGLALVGAYLLINQKGSAAWQEYQARHEGTPLQWTAYSPARVPVAENFAAIPVIEEMIAKSGKGALDLPVPWPKLAVDLNKSERFQPELLREGFLKAQPRGKGGKATSASLEVTDNAAKDVIAMLEKFHPYLEQMRQAAARPGCHFETHWEKGMFADALQLRVLPKAAVLFQMRGLCLINQGESAAAMGELRMLIRLSQAMRKEPLLIAGLVRGSLARAAQTLAWEGLAGQKWGEAEVGQLEEIFRNEDALADALHSFASERAGLNQLFDRLYENPASLPADMQALKSRGRYLYPRGWIRQSQLEINRHTDEYLTRLQGPVFDPRKPIHEAFMRENRGSMLKRLETMLCTILTPAFPSIEAQFWIRHARSAQIRVACALERHRLARGTYPERLAELGQTQPTDPMNGQEFRYEKTETGYRLWSVALNQKDDGGITGPGESAANRMLDWVWEVPGKVSPEKPTSRQEETRSPTSPIHLSDSPRARRLAHGLPRELIDGPAAGGRAQ